MKIYSFIFRSILKVTLFFSFSKEQLNTTVFQYCVKSAYITSGKLSGSMRQNSLIESSE